MRDSEGLSEISGFVKSTRYYNVGPVPGGMGGSGQAVTGRLIWVAGMVRRMVGPRRMVGWGRMDDRADATRLGAAPALGRGLAFHLVDATGRLSDPDARWLFDHAGAAGAVLGFPGEVRVRVVDDAEMSAAHMEYLEIEGTTDVLTFDMSEPDPQDPERPLLDVDVLVCLDEAARQAAVRGHTPVRELLLYVIHAVLHCAGYDDHDQAQAARMHAREDEILSAIGVGTTFGRGEVGGTVGAGDGGGVP